MSTAYGTVSNTDNIDTHKAEIALVSQIQARSVQRGKYLDGCYINVDLKGAMQGKMPFIGDLEIFEKTQRKTFVPNSSPDRANRWITSKNWWGSACVDGADLLNYIGNPANEFATGLTAAAYRQMDRELLLALCGTAYKGDYCNQTPSQLSDCSVMPDDCTGLTPEKLIKAKTLLDVMVPGDPVAHISITAMQMADLAQFDQFTSNDYFSGDYFENAGISKPWMNIRFKYVPDHRKGADGCCLDPIMKVDIDHYGPGKHRRWLMMWKRSSLAFTMPRANKIKVIPGEYRGMDIGTYVVQYSGSFGAARTDDCAVVLIPVCEENCHLGDCC